MKGRVTVAGASREWAVGGKPTREPAVKKTLKLREEIAWCESRTLPVAPVIGPVGATLGRDESRPYDRKGRPYDEVDVVRHQRTKVVPRELA